MSDALPPLREVIARHGLAARKSLGQNFLLDGQLLARIARVPGPLAGRKVYEVGPGPGGLTRALLAAGANVTTVERDARCLPALAELGEYCPGRLNIVEADALTIDEPALLARDVHVVANLPYNVGTPLLVRWLSGTDWPPWWASLTLMFQKEVAQRIVAAPGNAHYGRLAVLAQWRATARIAFEVNRAAFVPPPKVTSAVVHIRPGAMPAGVSPARLEAIAAAAFGQRRKMLRQSLKSEPAAEAAMQACGIDSARRAETLTIGEFIGLARATGEKR